MFSSEKTFNFLKQKLKLFHLLFIDFVAALVQFRKTFNFLKQKLKRLDQTNVVIGGPEVVGFFLLLLLLLLFLGGGV